MIKPMLTKTQNENEMKMKFRLFFKKKLPFNFEW